MYHTDVRLMWYIKRPSWFSNDFASFFVFIEWSVSPSSQRPQDIGKFLRSNLAMEVSCVLWDGFCLIWWRTLVANILNLGTNRSPTTSRKGSPRWLNFNSWSVILMCKGYSCRNHWNKLITVLPLPYTNHNINMLNACNPKHDSEAQLD